MEKLRIAPSTIPYYTTKLPITGIVIKYRPFLVKEEKVLLVAMQSGNPNQVIEAIRNMILACTDNQLDTKKIPAADANHAMLQIRAKSVGGDLKPVIKCLQCQSKTPVKLNVDKIQNTVIKEDANPNIKINDDITFVMRYPSIHDLDVTKDEATMLFEMAYSCIEKIIYKGEVHEKGLVNEDDVNLFVDSLLPEQFKKILQYLETAPSVKYEIDFNCLNCKNKVHVALENITDFFI